MGMFPEGKPYLAVWRYAFPTTRYAYPSEKQSPNIFPYFLLFR
jgi:hypothetical protein